MSGRSPGVRGGPGPPAGGSRCLLILQRCLAIQLQKVALLSEQRKSLRGHDEPEYWMYDSGYLLFQVRAEGTLLQLVGTNETNDNILSSNVQCRDFIISIPPQENYVP
jgi:hypothetical protein